MKEPFFMTYAFRAIAYAFCTIVWSLMNMQPFANFRQFFRAGACLAFCCTAICFSPTYLNAAPNFEDDILPVFKKNCLGCHNADKKQAGLDLSSFKAVQGGSSAGAVVKAGLPASSPLFMAVNHHDDYAKMPPEKPKLPSEHLKAIRDWIAGGLLASKNGKPVKRAVVFNIPAGSTVRPEQPAEPFQLPDIPVTKVRRPLPRVALASSPWANLVAVNGHEQILLYGAKKPPIEAEGFKPAGHEDLVTRRSFDKPLEGRKYIAGKVGNAIMLNGQELKDDTTPGDLLKNNAGFTFAAWLKPELDMKSPTVFGRESIYIMLERTRNGWRVRASSRAANNAIHYTGRVGEFLQGQWQHVAVTCDGKEWTFYYNGEEIVRQPIPADMVGFLDKSEPFYIGGDGRNEARRYQGGMDDLRIYKRALTKVEVAQMIVNVTPAYGHIGTLPFPAGDVHDLRFSRNGGLLVAAGGRGADSGEALIYNVRTGKVQATIGDEYDIVLSADISPDHKYVAIGTPAKAVKIFSTADGKLLQRIEKHTGWVTVVRFSPNGKWLATADRNGGIHIWETETGGIVYSLDEHKKNVTALSWRTDGNILASASDDGKFVLWNMKDGFAKQTTSAHVSQTSNRYSRTTGVLDLAFTRDHRLLTTGRDRSVKLWGVDGKTSKQAENLPFLPLSTAVSRDGHQAFVGDFAGGVGIWDLDTMKRTQNLQPE